MPTFCRHNRLQQNCRICSGAAQRGDRTSGGAAPPATRTAAAGAKTAKPRRRRGEPEVVTRRLERAADDGYENPLVPGLRASDDARRLADATAAAGAYLERLADDPPAPWDAVATQPDREEALWRAVQTALGVAPEDQTAWDDPPPGGDAARALAAWRSWAARAGGQGKALDGEPSWAPARRFARAFERLGTLPGHGREVRFALLVHAGALGLVDVEADALHPDLKRPDDASAAAKRIFGIADALLLEQRASDLADAAGVSLAALGLALRDWERRAPVSAPDGPVRHRARRALGVHDDA